MKLLLIRAGISLLLLSPVVVYAAYNDVTLDTTVLLSVNSIEVDVTGSTATLESITVDTTSFSVTLRPGSSITITAPSRNIMNAVVGAGAVASQTCTNSSSSLTLTANEQIAV